MNELFEILAEGATLEAEVMDKYLFTGLNEGNIKEFIADKAGVVVDTVKKLYEKVMKLIDFVIELLGTSKDGGKLGYANGLLIKAKIPFKTDREYSINHEYVHLEKLGPAVKVLREFLTSNKNRKPEGADGEKFTDEHKAEDEKAILRALSREYLSKLTKEDVTIDKISDIAVKTEELLVKPKGKLVIDKAKYDEVVKFAEMDMKENGTTLTLADLRSLRMEIKEEYRATLREIGTEARGKASADKDGKNNYKENAKFLVKLNFTISITAIIALLSVCQKGITYANTVAKAIDKGNKGSGKAVEKAEEKTEESSLDATLNLIEAAIAESELDVD